MKDAITQTDRSDYQIIKAKLMRDRILRQKLEDDAAQALMQRQDQPTLLPNTNKMKRTTTINTQYREPP